VATFLLTVKEVEAHTQGLRLSPGIRLSQTKDRPAIGSMMQGAKLELRRPDGRIRATSLLTYGVSVQRGADGALYMQDDPADAEIKLTLPADLSAEDVPVGTEVWLVE
jgi:hypothetical protein